MFEVLYHHIDHSCSELAEQNNHLIRDAECVSDVIHNLNSLSGMDEILQRLREKENILSDETRKMDILQRSLERINQTYKSCEVRIQDEVEQSRIKYPMRNVGTMNLRETRYIVQEFIS